MDVEVLTEETTIDKGTTDELIKISAVDVKVLKQDQQTLPSGHDGSKPFNLQQSSLWGPRFSEG